MICDTARGLKVVIIILSVKLDGYNLLFRSAHSLEKRLGIYMWIALCDKSTFSDSGVIDK